MADPTPWDAWTALGWSPRDVELLRAHAGAMGIQVTIPAVPPRIERRLAPRDTGTYQWRVPPEPPIIPPPVKEAPPVITTDKRQQNHITHVVFVLDASGSMGTLSTQVVKVADAQISYLAQRSKELDQETRVTVYTFDDTAKCLIYDKDVLRLPSLKDLYKIGGMTALVDATVLALDDLAMTPEKYGDHAFLVFVITDGQENASVKRYGLPSPADRLRNRMAGLPDHWTVATLVPNANGLHEAKQFGFPPGNIAVWDATSQRGLEEAMATVRTATDSFMTARKTGVRGTKNLFVIDHTVVNAATIKAAKLTPVDYDDYDLVPIPPVPKPDDYDATHKRAWTPSGGRIDEFVQNVRGGQYIVGQAYYQLVAGKAERVQASKNIAVVDKATDRVYTGRGARQLLNLPDMEVRIKPSDADQYLVYVQSKSPNRKLVPGCRLLIFKK